jgi:hypothetical protein
MRPDPEPAARGLGGCKESIADAAVGVPGGGEESIADAAVGVPGGGEESIAGGE